MKVINFRPYKSWGDTQLINEILKKYEIIRESNGNDNQNKDICDAMILEAKNRRLSCPKELMYKNILFK